MEHPATNFNLNFMYLPVIIFSVVIGIALVCTFITSYLERKHGKSKKIIYSYVSLALLLLVSFTSLLCYQDTQTLAYDCYIFVSPITHQTENKIDKIKIAVTTWLDDEHTISKPTLYYINRKDFELKEVSTEFMINKFLGKYEEDPGYAIQPKIVFEKYAGSFTYTPTIFYTKDFEHLLGY